MSLNQSFGHQPPLAPASSAQGGVPVCCDDVVQGADAPAAALEVLLATGTTLWDALVALAATEPEAERGTSLLGVPRRALRPFLALREAVLAFDTIAQDEPDGANAALAAILTGVRVGGRLCLNDLNWITSLPAGLVVEGGLDLTRTPIVALPAGLVVGDSLWLRGCRAWDGQIPSSAKVKGLVFSPAHPAGIALADWRTQHPQGEPVFTPEALGA
jgi:hypothetical protein